MPGGTPGTPSSKTKAGSRFVEINIKILDILSRVFKKFISFFALQEKIMLRAKVVVALYPFRAIEGGDLSLEKVKIKKKYNNKYIKNEFSYILYIHI